jgi:hypothetical protein
MSLGTVGIPLDRCRLLGVCHVVMWWFVFRNHKHPRKMELDSLGETWTQIFWNSPPSRDGGACVVRGCHSWSILFSQTTLAEDMPRTLVVGARYVDRFAAGARFGLQVARGSLPRLDLGGLGHLEGVDVGGRSQTEGEGTVARRHQCRTLGSFIDLEGVLPSC